MKKIEYDKLVNKVIGIDNTNFVSRTKYEKDGSDFEDKIDKIEKNIPDVSDLVKKSALAAVENKISDISGLATKSALTAVENKISDVSTLVKKTDYDTKTSGLATNSSLTAVENKIPNVTDLVTKTDFNAKLKAVSDRVTKNKSKDLLLDNELKKLKTFDADYFEVRNYFEGGNGTQNMLVVKAKNKYFGRNNLGNTQYYTWKSKGISNENFYYIAGNIYKKLTRPTHVNFGLDQFFFKMLVRLLLVLS